MSSVPKRRNGLTLPYSAPQVSAWIALIFTLLHFLVLISPLLPIAMSIPLTILFVGMIFTVCYFGLRCLAIDPMDPHLARALYVHSKQQEEEEQGSNDQNNNNNHRKRNPANNTKETSLSNWIYQLYNPPPMQPPPIATNAATGEIEMKQCWICDVQVHEQSMHCKYCNKCVGHFDHHCMWLNTCVGDRNYRDFFRVMLSIFFMQIVHLSTALGLVVDIFLEGPTLDRANAVFGSSSNSDVTIPVAALLLFGMLFDVVSLILLSQLIHFHIGLQRDKISTYQYIVRDHQRRREVTKLENELQSQRVLQMQKYRAESNHCAARQMQFGHFCRNIGCTMLDPMKLPSPPRCPEATTKTESTSVDAAAVPNGNGAAVATASPKPDVEAGFATALGNLSSPLADLNNNDDDDDDNDNADNQANGNAVEEEECARPTAAAIVSSSSPGPVSGGSSKAAAVTGPSMISSQASNESQFSNNADGGDLSGSDSSSSLQNRVPSLHHATLLAPDEDEEDDCDDYEDANSLKQCSSNTSSGGGGVSFIKVNPTNSSSSSPSSNSSPINNNRQRPLGIIAASASASLATGEHLPEQGATSMGTIEMNNDAASPTSSGRLLNPLPTLSPPR